MIYTTLTEKQYCLLENFKEVFISDHKSNLESVELASEKLVYLLTKKSNLAKFLINLLICIKETNSIFSIKLDENSHYDNASKTLYLGKQCSVPLFIHELTHLLHCFVDNANVDDNFIRKKFTVNMQSYIG